MKLNLISTLGASIFVVASAAFQPTNTVVTPPKSSLDSQNEQLKAFQAGYTNYQASAASTSRLFSFARKEDNDKSENFLMDQFKTADGEIINPYRVLKVSRNAERKEIRESYRSLSKKYHPDGVRYREILPGRCNNLDDVRNEWERIKLSYEVLSDRKLRIRYDRHEALNDPAAAVGRTAVNALGWGAMGIAKGIFNVGGLALKAAADGLAESQKDEEVSKNTSSSKAAESRMKSTLKSPRLLTGDVLMFQGFEFQDELPMVNSNGAVAFDARMQMDAEIGFAQIMKRTFMSFVNALEDLLSMGNSLATRFLAGFFKRRVNEMV